MTALRNILLLGILATVIVVLLTTDEPSSDTAKLFLGKLSAGDAASVIPFFGDNTCHCQPRGGYRAYLCYESGENDNLAFLLGQKFSFSQMESRQVPVEGKDKYKGSDLPWEQPESTEVDVPIDLAGAGYKPYFLPLDTAYGHEISESSLKEFALDPSERFWNSLALRLRPSLKPGLVEKPLPAKVEAKPEFMSDLYLQLLPAEEAKYIRPADPGAVKTSTGKSQDLSDFESSIPRLKSCVLRLYVVRRGRLQRWAVRKARVKDPVFELSGGKLLALKSPEESLKDKPGQGGVEEREANESKQASH